MVAHASLVHPGSGQNANMSIKSSAEPIFAIKHGEAIRGREPRHQSCTIDTGASNGCNTFRIHNGRTRASYGNFCEPCLAVLLKKAKKLWGIQRS